MAPRRGGVVGRRGRVLIRTIFLLAGPSGSGKSRLARLTGCPRIALDDFYHPADHPELPNIRLGERDIVDWDDVRSWSLAEALAALVDLSRTGSATVPLYSLSTSARVGHHRLDLGESPAVVAEGIFAPELLDSCSTAGLSVQPIWVDRPRALTAMLRLARDLRERRKPPTVLLRRGFALWRSEPALRAKAVAAGFQPLGFSAARQLISAALTPDAGQGRAHVPPASRLNR